MPAEWSLGYPRYMIEDGCPDIECGQILDWSALEFSSENTLAISKTNSRNALEVDDQKYSRRYRFWAQGDSDQGFVASRMQAR